MKLNTNQEVTKMNKNNDNKTAGQWRTPEQLAELLKEVEANSTTIITITVKG